MAFLLSAGTLSGSWSFSGSQSLSHAAIYGGTRDDQLVVPIPAAVWLLGSGLLGLLGFELTTFLFMIGWTRFMERLSWRKVLFVSAGVTAGLYLVFVWFLGVPVPAGFWKR